MSNKDEPGRWRAEPEVASATGGHLAPEQPTSARRESLFDPLDEPLPSERLAGAPPAETRSLAGDYPPATRARRKTVRRRAGVRRVKRTIRHVDPFSVLKLSMFFYGCALIVWLLFVALVYTLLESMGLFDAIEKFGGPRGLVLWEDLDITLGVVERWALLIGLAFWVVGNIVNTVIAILYNVGADLLGGVELTFVEKDV